VLFAGSVRAGYRAAPAGNFGGGYNSVEGTDRSVHARVGPSASGRFNL